MKDLKITDSGKEISSIELEQFIQEFNLNLPNDYKTFILKTNGGYPGLSTYFDGDNGFDIQSFNQVSLVDEDILSSLDEVYSSRDAILTHQINEDNIPKHLYPFGLDGGGNIFTISMAEADLGTIYVYYMDGQTPSQKFVCSSFKGFIEGLVENFD